MTDEVAVFVDIENLRYGLLNEYGQEPDISYIVNKAKKYGRPSIMRAYADFSEHPDTLTRELQVAGVEAINVPVKRTTYTRGQKEIERIKNAADMVMAIDALTEAMDCDGAGKLKSFLLVTGDGDFVRLVTQLRNRFGQKVVISGVPGSIAPDLVAAAGNDDPIEVVVLEPVDSLVLKKAIVAMVRKGPSPLSYWSLKMIDTWAQDERQAIEGTATEKRDAIGQLRDEGALVQNEINHPKRGTVLEAKLDEGRARELGYID